MSEGWGLSLGSRSQRARLAPPHLSPSAHCHTPACWGPSQSLPRGFRTHAAAAATDEPRPALLPPSGSWQGCGQRKVSYQGQEKEGTQAGVLSEEATCPQRREAPTLESKCGLPLGVEICPKIAMPGDPVRDLSLGSLGHYGKTRANAQA